MLCTLLAASTAAAQSRPRLYDPPTIIAGNALIGGVTAALRAAIDNQPIGKAFLGGAFGGAVHGSAKLLSTELPAGGYVLGAAGTSMVANAANSVALLEELVVPVGPARIRMSFSGPTRVDVTLNAFETVTLARRLAGRGTRVDWTESLQAGTFVLRTSEVLYSAAGHRAAGITSGPTVLLSDHAPHPERTLRHERIHVHQGWFTQEVWGRPLENNLRRAPGMRFVPRWLELGIAVPVVLEMERQAFGTTGPLRSWRESEGESLEGSSRR